mgnify:FL=1
MQRPLYFISDVHLMLSRTNEELDRREKLYRLLDHIASTGGTVFFVWGLFDFYYEYPDVIPKEYFKLYAKVWALKEQGIDFHFLVGNHDYWVMDFMTEKLMTYTHLSDFEFEINGKKFYITHGDGLLSWDYGYRFLKKIIRSKLFVGLFRWIHPTVGFQIARWVSKSGPEYDISDALTQKIRNELMNFAQLKIENGFDYIVFGHYHLGEMMDINQGKLAVLGDWFNTPRYAVFDGEQFEMKDWE